MYALLPADVPLLLRELFDCCLLFSFWINFIILLLRTPQLVEVAWPVTKERDKFCAEFCIDMACDCAFLKCYYWCGYDGSKCI